MNLQSSAALKAAIGELPPILQDVARRQLERFDALADRPDIDPRHFGVLVRLLACSEFGANTFLRESSWLMQQDLDAPPNDAEQDAFAAQVAASDAELDVVKHELRRFRNRIYLHILWREIAASATLNETLAALSGLADRLLGAAAEYAHRSIERRFGAVLDEHGQEVRLLILGMGKLGGRELNFSSDIDLIFLYPGGTASNGPRSLSPQEYFTRVSQLIVALIDETTADGFVFRVDTRLRPFGDSGPPVASFSALESYLVQHGRGWERYAYVKARSVGPRQPAAVLDDLYNNLITPFVYRRYLDFGVFESLREMQALIAAEVKRRDLADNIKLGPGGIREIEFIVQSLQLVRGGSNVELQGRALQQILPRLTGRHGIDDSGVKALQSAYTWLRRLENFIQAIRDQQSHSLPVDALDQARLATAMAYESWDRLLDDLGQHRDRVSQQFGKLAFRAAGDPEAEAGSGIKQQIAALWRTSAAEEDWLKMLQESGFADPQAIAENIVRLRSAATHADATAAKRVQQFVQNLLTHVQVAAEPGIAVERVVGIGEQVLRRSAYLALLNENISALEKLIDLCSRSAYIANQIARYPVLLDELLDPRIYSDRLTREKFDDDLQQRLKPVDAADSEARMEILAAFQRANQFRIALADFNGNLPIMRVSDALTDVAESVLSFALELAWRDTSARHGVPVVSTAAGSRDAGFGIIAYGKLGGLELSYGSDLDLVFLHDSPATGHSTNGDKPLDNTMFFTRLVRRLVHFLTTQTGSGILYEIDTRLRPDGKSGLLVTSVEAFERYQEENAWTWEHQALLRARPVAGSETIARQFTEIRQRTLSAGLHRDTLKRDVIEMRARMRKQLDTSNEEVFDLKQGEGGIGDIEFLVQYLVLLHASRQPAVYFYTDNIRQLDALADTAVLQASLATRLQDAYRAFRLRAHHLRLDDRPATVAQQEFAAERQFVIEMWDAHLAGAHGD